MKRPGNRFFPIFMKVQNLSFKFIIFSEKEFNFSSEAFDYMKMFNSEFLNCIKEISPMLLNKCRNLGFDKIE